MKIVRYLENGKITVGQVFRRGFLLSKRLEVSYMRPDIDNRLIYLLADIVEKRHVETTHPQTSDIGIIEVIVKVKINDKMFWPTLDHTLRMIGYNLED